MSRTRWGVVFVGAAAGLGLTAVGALLLFAAGLRPDRSAEGAAFIFVQFLGQLAAGVVGGRLGHPLALYHGSQAALLLFAVSMAVTLAAGGDPGVPTIVFSAVVAVVIGGAGGVLGGMRRRPPGREARGDR